LYYVSQLAWVRPEIKSKLFWGRDFSEIFPLAVSRFIGSTTKFTGKSECRNEAPQLVLNYGVGGTMENIGRVSTAMGQQFAICAACHPPQVAVGREPALPLLFTFPDLRAEEED